MKIAQKASYFHDPASGWLHIKMTILEDRQLGGTLTEKLVVDGQLHEASYNIGPSPNFEGKAQNQSNLILFGKPQILPEITWSSRL